MGAVDLVLQIESPKSVARGLQRIGRAGHGVGEVSPRADLPQVPRRPARVHGRRAAHARRPDRADRRAEKRAGRSRSADRRHFRCTAAGPRGRPIKGKDTQDIDDPEYLDEGISVDELHALVTQHLLLRRALARAARERARHARRALSVEGVRRAARADRLGSRRRHDPRAQGLAPARDRQRRHDPRPRPLRGHAARRAARRRARRGDGLRGAPRPGVPARRLLLADRGNRPRPRDRHARARRARRGAVLEGRLGRAPARARRSDRRVLALGRRAGARDAASATTTSTRAPRATCSTTCASSRPRRASCRASARSSSSASATRSATGGSASSPPTAGASTPPGRSRCPRGSASASRWRPTRSPPTTGSSCTCPTSTPTTSSPCLRPPSWS